MTGGGWYGAPGRTRLPSRHRRHRQRYACWLLLGVLAMFMLTLVVAAGVRLGVTLAEPMEALVRIEDVTRCMAPEGSVQA